MILKVPNYNPQSETDSPWYIFNDFTVQNVSENEALSFSGPWKVCLENWAYPNLNMPSADSRHSIFGAR